MKKYTLLLIFILSVCVSFSQDYFEWSEEQLITDTLSDYSNPFVIPIAYDAWMFYQKNDARSSIIKMNLTTINDIVPVLESESFNYANPSFIWRGNPDYIGYLFYLSDMDGYNNLYASKYYENDSVGESIAVCKNLQGEDITEYSVSEESFITFLIDSLVYVAELKFYSDSVYTENETIVDSSSYGAKVKFREVCWQKQVDGNSNIFISYLKYNEDAEEFYLTVASYLDSIGNSHSLDKSSSVFGWGYNHFCWINNNYIKVYSGSSSFDQYDTINNFDQEDVRQISMVNWDIAVKYPYELPHYLAFTVNQGESAEIFSSHGEFGMEDSAQISNNSYMDEYPNLFFGESVNGWGTEAYYVYCVWQSHINGNIELSMSKAKAWIGSSIKENIKTDNYLKVSPNPFTDRLKISYNNHNRVSNIKIISAVGSIVADYKHLTPSNNWEYVNWQTLEHNSKGIYVVLLTIGSEQISTIVVLN